jgi:hypothetical protein
MSRNLLFSEADKEGLGLNSVIAFELAAMEANVRIILMRAKN